MNKAARIMKGEPNESILQDMGLPCLATVLAQYGLEPPASGRPYPDKTYISGVVFAATGGVRLCAIGCSLYIGLCGIL